MAHPNGIDWEIRSTATAGNVGGGGFVRGGTGTDFSQFDAVQIAVTGATSSGAGNVVLSASAAASWVDNIVNVLSGSNFTTGAFHCASVVVGVSATFSTNQSGASITTGVGAAGAINIGGAKSMGSSDDTVFEQGTPGSVFYVKAGTYTVTAVSISVVGTGALPINIVGYSSTRLDGPIAATRPVFDMTTNSFGTTTGWSSNYIKYISSNTTRTYLGSASGRFIHSSAINISATSTSTGASNIGYCYASEFVSLRGLAFQTANSSMMLNCHMHHSDVLYNATAVGGFAQLVGCILESGVTNAIKAAAITAAGSLNVHGCTIYGSEAKLGVGMAIPTGGMFISLTRSLIAGCVTGVSHADTQVGGLDRENNYYNNTADVSAAGQWQKGASDTALNQAFSSVTQLTGTTATTSGGKLVASGFGAVVPFVDYVLIHSGTGVVAGFYYITAVSATELTVSPAMTNDSTADKVYTVFQGHVFQPAVAMMSTGFPMPNALVTSWNVQGAVQRKEDYPTAAQTFLGVSFGNSAYTGTRRDATASEVLLASVYGPGDTFTGTRRDALTSKVALAYVYGPSDTFTGTVREPPGAKVELSYAYGAADATTGTARIPPASVVLTGYLYGASDATTGSLAVTTNPILFSLG